jgi:hypothetical protein
MADKKSVIVQIWHNVSPFKVRCIDMKFRKKPIIIEAYQTKEEKIIQTLEGPLRAAPGDWIITGLRGEKYPCKPDIFEKTYELVN